MHLMTFAAPDNPPPPPNFKIVEIMWEKYHCTALKIPEILRCHMIFTCRLIFQPAAAPAPVATPDIH